MGGNWDFLFLTFFCLLLTSSITALLMSDRPAPDILLGMCYVVTFVFVFVTGKIYQAYVRLGTPLYKNVPSRTELLRTQPLSPTVGPTLCPACAKPDVLCRDSSRQSYEVGM